MQFKEKHRIIIYRAILVSFLFVFLFLFLLLTNTTKDEKVMKINNNDTFFNKIGRK